MKKAFVFASIGLIVLMIFTANSALGEGWGLFYDENWTVATEPGNIVGENDGYVTSLGTSENPVGVIFVILDEFQTGDGWDIRIHGYDVDNISEQYRLHLGEWDEVYGPHIIIALNELYNDTDGTVYFDLGNPDPPIILNMIVLQSYPAVIPPPPGGDWPGPEIDAVYARY